MLRSSAMNSWKSSVLNQTIPEILATLQSTRQNNICSTEIFSQHTSISCKLAPGPCINALSRAGHPPSGSSACPMQHLSDFRLGQPVKTFCSDDIVKEMRGSSRLTRFGNKEDPSFICVADSTLSRKLSTARTRPFSGCLRLRIPPQATRELVHTGSSCPPRTMCLART